MMKVFLRKPGYSLLKNEEISDEEAINMLIPKKIYQYFPKYPNGPLRQEFDTIMKKLAPQYKKYIMENGLSTFLVYTGPSGYFDLLSKNTELVKEKVNFIKGSYELKQFLSKYEFPDEIGKLCSLKVAHINYLVQRYEISNLCLPNQTPFHLSYLNLLLDIRYPTIQSLFQKIPTFCFDNLITLSKEIEKWKLDQSWKEFDLYWQTYDLDSYFHPWTYARSYMIVQNDTYRPQTKYYYSLFLLRLDFSTLISGSYLGVDGVFYFLQLFDLYITHNRVTLWMIEGLGYYNRPEVYHFCKVNEIQKEFIGILIKDKTPLEHSKFKKE